MFWAEKTFQLQFLGPHFCNWRVFVWISKSWPGLGLFWTRGHFELQNLSTNRVWFFDALVEVLLFELC
jgi:hypothetical protein